MTRKEWEAKLEYIDKKSKDDKRKRSWAFLIYPGDSCPDDWEIGLDMLHIRAAVSPLHYGDEESNFKPHRHVQLQFDGKKSFEQIKEISDLFNGSRPIEVKDPPSYARYLLHLSNPDKQQFEDDSDLKIFGGFDYWHLAEIQSDIFKSLKEMQEFVIKNGIYKFNVLADYAALYRMDWYRVLTTRATMYIKEYMRSRNNEFKQERTEDTKKSNDSST